MSVLIFVGGYQIFGPLLMGRVGLLLPDWFFTVWGGLAILSLNGLWVVVAFKFWHGGNVKFKLFLTSVIIALSASLLFSSWIVKAFAESMH